MYDSIIIVGPTASGKTKISIELAKRLKTDIFNADSMYIYKYLNIGTAKPTLEEMDGVKHHLIDIANPQDNFNVVDYRNIAEQSIKNFLSQNKIPIFTGGTGFYIDSLIKNYSYGDTGINNEIRKQLEQDLVEKGKDFIYNKLKSFDTITAEKLHPNDTVRVIRALEICLSGRSKNDCTNSYEPILKNPLIIGLNFSREVLYDRINKRVDIMVENGLIGEVQQLVSAGFNPIDHQSMRGIGYKEIYDYLKGETTLEFAIEKIKQHTRNYAKRQITWFKRNQDIIWLNPLDNSLTNLIENIISYLK